jgi:hypothetical protein
MVALVDLHKNSVVACGAVKPQKMADSTALEFWRQVATRYRSNPLVAFDLYNEPHDISDDVWLRGGRIVAGNGVAYTAAGMQQMYDAVRSTGARNLVIVSGNDWANRLPRELSGAENVAYGVHVYTCPTSTDPASCTPDPMDPSPTLNNYTSVAATSPVVISEFGWPSAADGRYAAHVISYARDHGWGWIAFAWDGGNAGDFSLLATMNSTYQPSPAGMPVLTGLNAP